MNKTVAVAVIAGICTLSGTGKAETTEQSVKCLADNIYYEARDDGRAGWNAVGHVTLNRWHRARQLRSSVTVCNIVYAGARHGHHHCQFSWTCHGRPGVQREAAEAARIHDFAYRLFTENLNDPTDGATYFHEKRVHPSWAHDGTAIRTTSIGRHYFYRPAHQTEVAMFFDAK